MGERPRVHDLDWESLRVFTAVARAGSFSRASKVLGIEQSTVSRRVAQLEAALDQALFERHAGGARLTPFGEQLARRTRVMEQTVVELGDDLGKHEREVRGEVRLALAESVAVHLVIPRILSELFARHPALRLKLMTSYAVADLGHRDAELALRFFRPHEDDLVAERVLTMPLIWAGRQQYVGRSPAELDFVAVELERVEAYETAILRRHVPRPPRLVVGSYVEQIEAIRAGLGVGLVARSVLGLDPELVNLELGLPTGRPLEQWLVTPKSLRRVPRIDAVWRAVQEGFCGFDDAT